MQKVILIFLTLFFLSSCKDVPKFPVDEIWEVEVKDGLKECYRYDIVSHDPLKVSDGVKVDLQDCPLFIMGFEGEQDSAEVFSWIREVQKMAKQRFK
jgi:hypothetical protein